MYVVTVTKNGKVEPVYMTKNIKLANQALKSLAQHGTCAICLVYHKITVSKISLTMLDQMADNDIKVTIA